MRRRFHFVFQSYVLLAIIIFLPYISQCLKWCRSKAIGKQQVSSWREGFIKYIRLPLARDVLVVDVDSFQNDTSLTFFN